MAVAETSHGGSSLTDVDSIPFVDRLNIEASVVELATFRLCKRIVDPDIFGRLLVQKTFLSLEHAEDILNPVQGVPDHIKVLNLLKAVVTRIDTVVDDDSAERLFKAFVTDVLRHDHLQVEHISQQLEEKYSESLNRNLHLRHNSAYQ